MHNISHPVYLVAYQLEDGCQYCVYGATEWQMFTEHARQISTSRCYGNALPNERCLIGRECQNCEQISSNKIISPLHMPISPRYKRSSNFLKNLINLYINQ